MRGDGSFFVIPRHDRLARTKLQGTPQAGIPPLLLEIQGPRDPVREGTDITYSIRISNTGAERITDIVLISAVPEGVEFKKAQGPSRFHLIKKEIIFDALPTLKPKSEVYYKVAFRSIREGDVWFKARVSSLHSEDCEMEHTKVIPKK